jgi:hypothetical protein
MHVVAFERRPHPPEVTIEGTPLKQRHAGQERDKPDFHGSRFRTESRIVLFRAHDWRPGRRETVQVREARGRRRRPWVCIGSPSGGVSEYRSIRMAGRMMTIADSAFFPTDFPRRAACQTPGNLTTVPISYSPAFRLRPAAPAHQPAQGK